MYKSLEVQCVDDERSFLALKDEWNALVDDASTLSLFGRHEWFTSAWRWRRFGSALNVFCVYRGKDLIGVLPLLRTSDRRIRIRCDILSYFAVPDSQWCDLIVAEGDVEPVSRALATSIAGNRRSWDVLEFEKLAKDSRIVTGLLPALFEAGFLPSCIEDSSNPGIAVCGNWDDYYASRTKRLRSGNSNIANKVKRAATYVEVLWSGDGSISPDAALEDVITTSAASWKRDTGLTLNQPGPGAFIEHLTKEAKINGWLSIWTLRLDGRPVATEYQVIYAGRVFALRADYDEQFRSVSPGSFLNWKLLERLYSASIDYYSMGPGENPYKDRWATRYETQFKATVFGKSTRGALLRIVENKCKPILHSIANQLKIKK